MPGQQHSGASETFPLPGVIINMVEVPRLSDKVRAVASGGANVVSITQPRPRAG